MSEFKKGVTAQKVGSVVAKGSHSLVYKCKINDPNDSTSEIPVALKEYSVPAPKSDAQKEQQEGALVRLMDLADDILGLEPHDNIAKVYGVEMVKGIANRELDRVLITMQWIETSPACKAVAGPLPEDEVRVILKGLVSAVAHLHGAGITHDDMRPANVFKSMSAGKDGEPGILLTDATFFKPIRLMLDPNVGEVTTQQAPNFTAPEIFTDGTDYDPFKADVWGVGAIAVALLNGKPPYHELDPRGTGAIMFKLIQGRKPPQYDKSKLPGPFVEFLDKVFTWSYDDRPSIEDLVEDPLFS